MLRAMRHVSRWFVVGALAIVGCGNDTDTNPTPPEKLEITEGCNPIAASADCMLPYPSDFFRADEKVSINEAAWLELDGKKVDMLALHRPDGFSVGSPILALLGAPIDDAPLVFWTDADTDRSTTPDSPTLLVDAETGEPVLHFAELDARSLDPLRKALIIRPLVRLEPSHRYVVGIRGLSTPEGEAIDPPAGFKSLRDEAGKAHPSLEAISPRYESDIFPVLEAAGFERDGLQLAWDFTTRSEEDATGDMFAIREDMLARLDEGPPGVNVRSVEPDVNEHIARRIDLTIQVPLYVSSIEPGATLNGSPPVATDTVEVPVTVWIPPSVANRKPGSPPARLLQFGHGFFGDRYESDDFPAAFADEHGFVVVAADWWGMAANDRGFVAGELASNPGNTLVFTDRVHQAMANFMALAAAAQGPIAELPELEVGGEPAYDPSHLYFYGISNGHILGGTYLALSPNVERAALCVGGANLGLMLFRARPFLPFLALLQAQLSDPVDQQKFGALAQSVFDRIDPMTYAPYVLEHPLEGSPDRRIAMQLGIGDADVPNIGTYFDAKILGVPAFAMDGASEKNRPAWLDVIDAPTDGSALTTFDFGVEPSVTSTPTPDSNTIHNDTRRLAASQQQFSDFLAPDGTLAIPCDGPCDPE